MATEWTGFGRLI